MYFIGEPHQRFGGSVDSFFFYYKKENIQQKDVVISIVQKICDIWAKARISIDEERDIVCKIDTLLDKYRNICRNKTRGGSAQQVKEDEFVMSCNLLFDIADQDAINLTLDG